ncbi:helix-turn-helix transcriptional regulator [Ornithinicoccus halotolerans]|uniref:helix-turn-helix transcriptional regulator n=1 Tax=Ornithinicoccus halotolerans TaxID=1748220 RepID=UPI001294DBD4|nr:helix-turn-helix domain-containing protein [Ornithinicoccus halotolerans]
MTLDLESMQNFLDTIGMGAVEEAVYRRLMASASCSGTEVARDLGVPIRETRAVLRWLESKGLVVRTAGTRDRYAAAPPDTALGPVIAGQEEQLRLARDVLATLTSDYQAARAQLAAQLVEVVTGEVAIGQRFQQLQSEASSELLFLVKPPFVVDNGDNEAELELLARGVVVRSIYDSEVLDRPGGMAGVRRYVDAGEQARVVPRLPAKLCVVDRSVALLPLVVDGGRQAGALAVRASELLDTLLALFSTLWGMGAPLPAATPSDGAGSPAVTRDEREILALMYAGLTDYGIARQLDASQRTVQRHVRALMDRFDASSRFQLGAIARERGLIVG